MYQTKKSEIPKNIKQMKINWGTSIIIAFALFMTFILYFVVKVQSNKKYDNEMVVKDYYKHDITFQKDLDKTRNAEELAQKPTISITEKGIEVIFPKDFIPKKVIGEIFFYRPSDEKSDFKKTIELDDNSKMTIPKSVFADGRWNITIAWDYDQKSYTIEKSITVK